MNIVAIAYNSNTKNCCLIKSLATYEMLKENFGLYNKSFEATNWCGCDNVPDVQNKRDITVDFSESFDMTGKISGTDSDHGHSYPWIFEYDKIVKVNTGKPEVETKNEYIFSDFNIEDFKNLKTIKKWHEMKYNCIYEDSTFKIIKNEFNMIFFSLLFDRELAVMVLTYLDKEELELVNETMKELEEFLGL